MSHAYKLKLKWENVINPVPKQTTKLAQQIELVQLTYD